MGYMKISFLVTGQFTVEKTSNPWIELGNDLIDVSPTWGTGLENNFVKENVWLVYGIDKKSF